MEVAKSYIVNLGLLIQVEGKTVKAQIWDAAGQERHRAITIGEQLVPFLSANIITKRQTFDDV